MLNKLKKSKGEGFTIIEVMIVLVIAALILLIVFLAIPALQRNGRNTQRKNDVAQLLASVAEFSNNNNGNLPNTCSGTTPVTFDRTGGGTFTTSQVRPGYYNQLCATVVPPAAVSQIGLRTAYANTGPFNTAAQDFVVIVPGGQCDNANPGQTIAGSARQWAAVYEIEDRANHFAPACQDS